MFVDMYNATGHMPTATDKNAIGVAGCFTRYANYAELQVCI